MKFLVDMPLSPAVAAWLSDKGHDAVHASEIGLAAAPDPEILKRAQDEERVIITADLDYPRLLAMAGERSPGLLLFRGGNFSERECVARLQQVLRAMPETDLVRSIIVVEEDRLRRRRLPIR